LKSPAAVETGVATAILRKRVAAALFCRRPPDEWREHFSFPTASRRGGFPARPRRLHCRPQLRGEFCPELWIPVRGEAQKKGNPQASSRARALARRTGDSIALPLGLPDWPLRKRVCAGGLP